jgi:hypothetical protein
LPAGVAPVHATWIQRRERGLQAIDGRLRPGDPRFQPLPQGVASRIILDRQKF